MTVLRLSEFCCQAGNKTVDLQRYRPDDLLISSQGELDLIFSPLGHRPPRPKIALVGITPGGQWEKFSEYLLNYGVVAAARKAAFFGGRSTICKLLEAHGLA